MYSLKERIAPEATLAAPGSAVRPRQAMPSPPMPVVKRRRPLSPFFFHMGPVALCITSVLLIGLMAVLYLSQVGQAVAANQQIQDMHAQQADLQRQDQDLAERISQEQSPAYITETAKKLGLIPATPEAVQVLVVPHLEAIPTYSRPIQP